MRESLGWNPASSSEGGRLWESLHRGVASNKIYRCTDKHITPQKAIGLVTKDFLEREDPTKTKTADNWRQ